MINDKDYMIRIVLDFSNFLSKLLMEKYEGEATEVLLVFDTQMKDIFHEAFETLSQKSKEEIISLVDEKESLYQADYYDLLANLFYYKYKKEGSKDFADKAKTFYEIWIKKSSTFSLSVMKKIRILGEAL